MKDKIKQLLFLSLSFIFFVLLFYGLIMMFDNNNQKEIVSNVSAVINIEEIEDKLSINKISLLQDYYDNTDIKGIVSIEGINDFDYPVVQTIDNDYYLNHNYYKEYDSYGSIYADYRVNLDNSKKVLIFGHSSIKREMPFNKLENYYHKDYYNKYKYITLETETDIYRYEIFSVYVETNDFTYMNMNFDNKEDWYLHIMGLKKKSLYDTNVELDMDDDILILQTCSTNSNYKNYSKKYLLIVSRRVK